MGDQIREFATAREIPYLLHFTRAENLASIMRHGIVPIGEVSRMGISALINDAQRLDYQPMANSLSIAFPNSRMFYKYRQEDSSVDWTVLAIKTQVLWERPCAFCQRNAADALVTAVPIRSRMTAQALASMYEEIEGLRSRSEQKLRIFDPTHDQAEVLVFGTIGLDQIFGAAFNSALAERKYRALLDNRQVIQCKPNGSFFGSRSFSREY